MGPVNNNFKYWWKTHILRIGQPHKMLRDVRNSKWSTELSATLMEILVRGENHNVSNLVFSHCMSECLAKLQDTVISLLHCYPRQNFLQRQSSLLGLSYHFVMQSSGSQYLQKTCSPSPMALYHYSKTNKALFHAEWPFKLVYVASLSSRRRAVALWGNLSPL